MDTRNAFLSKYQSIKILFKTPVWINRKPNLLNFSIEKTSTRCYRSVFFCDVILLSNNLICQEVINLNYESNARTRWQSKRRLPDRWTESILKVAESQWLEAASDRFSWHSNRGAICSGVDAYHRMMFFLFELITE